MFLLGFVVWRPEVIDGGEGHIESAFGEFLVALDGCFRLWWPAPVADHERQFGDGGFERAKWRAFGIGGEGVGGDAD